MKQTTSSIDTQRKHYEHVRNSVKIYGENNGKLYAAFAHYENGELIVDSYFPISHGSKMQNKYLEERGKDASLTLLDIKYLIGAGKQYIHQFEKKCLEKIRKILPKTPAIGLSTGIIAGSITGNAARAEIKKLNKERNAASTQNSELFTHAKIIAKFLFLSIVVCMINSIDLISKLKTIS